MKKIVHRCLTKFSFYHVLVKVNHGHAFIVGFKSEIAIDVCQLIEALEET